MVKEAAKSGVKADVWADDDDDKEFLNNLDPDTMWDDSSDF